MEKKDIKRICGSVDLYEALQNPIDTWKPYGSGGGTIGITDLVDSVNTIIKEEFDKNPALSRLSYNHINYFFEFSILPTVLDPVSLDKLECFSFLWGDDTFKDIFRVKLGATRSLYEQVIADMLETDKISVFHHPNFLYDIGADGTDPVTVTDVTRKGLRKVKDRKAEEKSIMMPRSFSETLQISKDYYSLPSYKKLGEVQETLHKNLLSKITDSEDSFFISFPIIGAHSSNQLPQNIVSKNTTRNVPTQGIGAFFLYIESNYINHMMASNIGEQLFVSIGELGRLYAANYLFNLGLRLQEKAKKEAEKSAKAAIMSRNMSHNIGSHVMSYLKQHLGSVKDIVTDGILSDLINGENELAKKLENTTENTTLPFLMGLGHFISYLQERQDFIATIATDYIPYFGNVNFKDAIYDELNPDKRALRHSDRKNGSTDNILLGNIARSEGLGRSTSPTQHDSNKVPLNDIVLKFRTRFDGNPVVEIDDSGRITAVKDEVALGELDDMRKIDFSLPGGIVGRQAFFSIMENIIRNAAKHGNWRSMGNLELTFDVFSSKKEDVKRLENFNDDNVDEHSLTLKEVISNYYLEATDSKDLYFVTITDNCTMVTNRDGKQSWETIGKLRASLMSPYITDSGEMDGTNKGLKEIRISSAWLRAIHDESECFEPYGKGTKAALLINDKSEAWEKVNTEKKAPLIYVRISAEKGLLGLDASRLQYIICVQIPRKVALILKNDDKLQTIKTNLERINWRAYSKEDFLLERNKSFEFIIVDDLCDGYDNAFNDIRQYATARTFCLSDVKGLDRTDFLNRIKDENYTGSEDLELLYKTLSQYNENEMIVVDDKVVFERGKKNNPSKDVTIGEGKCMIQIHDGYKGTNSVYIYRRHHEANKEFTDFMESRMNALFVEGITGNNSTDRLVRNETLNSSWFYRHLHAMKQRIAIFDERLFHKITGLEEKDLKAKKLENCKDNTALAYIQKGVFPFTFVEDDNDEGCYLLKGIVFDQEAPVIEVEKVEEDAQSPINTYHCKCDTLAILRLIDGKLEPTSSSYGEYMENLFDFITIHQGLLDKLYEKFKIKDDIEGKKTITKTLFETYSRKKELSNGFIPGMIIHSGRSKPNKLEMPQMFPFIQYAALEHAVMDCKYSLVELLDFARYEE